MRRPARIIAVVGTMLALLAWPIGVLADTGPGGNADLGLDGVTISRATVQPRTALVTVAGQIDCSQDLEAFVWVEVSQVVGRVWTVYGSGETLVDCLASDGSTDFSVSFYAGNGKFVPGRARLAGFAETGYCTEEECFYDDVEIGPMTMRLRR
jgi:hypothetical protein